MDNEKVHMYIYSEWVTEHSASIVYPNNQVLLT